MALERKHTILIVGSVLLAAALGIGLYLILRKPDEQELAEETTDEKSNQAATPSTAPATAQSSIQNGEVVPIFNEEKELANSLSQLLGKVLYPKRKYLGGMDFANVRSSAEVNNDTGYFDFSDNLITTINAGTPIGKVLGEASGLYNKHAYRWFKVQLTKPVTGFWTNTLLGYVRADTVTFQPYTA